MRTAFFWGITQRVVAISYRRFGTAYRSHLQGSRIQKKVFCPNTTHSSPPSTCINPTGWHHRNWDFLPPTFFLYKLSNGTTGFLLDSPLKMEPIGCPETSVRYCHYSLRNNSEERSSHSGLWFVNINTQSAEYVKKNTSNSKHLSWFYVCVCVCVCV